MASVQKQHNLQRMNTAGEDGDVNEKLLETCNERAKEITIEYKPEDVWNMDENGRFLERSLTNIVAGETKCKIKEKRAKDPGSKG